MAIILGLIHFIYFFINGLDAVVNFGLIAVSTLIIVVIMNSFYNRGYNAVKLKVEFEISNDRVAQPEYQEIISEFEEAEGGQATQTHQEVKPYQEWC